MLHQAECVATPEAYPEKDTSVDFLLLEYHNDLQLFGCSSVQTQSIYVDMDSISVTFDVVEAVLLDSR